MASATNPAMIRGSVREAQRIREKRLACAETRPNIISVLAVTHWNEPRLLGACGTTPLSRSRTIIRNEAIQGTFRSLARTMA